MATDEATRRARLKEADRRRRARRKAEKLGLPGPPLMPRGRQKCEKTPEELALQRVKTRARNRIASADYRARHPERRRATRTKYNDANRESKNLKERQRAAFAENRARKKKLKRRRYKDSIQFRLSEVLRATISTALRRKRSGLRKCAPTMRLIGCTIAELMVHLESQFLPGMSWDNYGMYGWHIDHKRPLSSYNLADREQQLAAFSWQNLQPLWAEDNLSKGARLDWTPPLKKAA